LPAPRIGLGRRVGTRLKYLSPDQVKVVICLPQQGGAVRAVGRHALKGGVDVVSWRPFAADASAGCPVILVQCTFRKDWHRKGRDIVLDAWRSWIAFAKDPITALAVPFCMSDDDERRAEIEAEVWLVLDRIRICELLCDAGEDEVTKLEDLGLADWLAKQVVAYDPAAQEVDEDDDANAPYPYEDERP
jgi:hypothetical protein